MNSLCAWMCCGGGWCVGIMNCPYAWMWVVEAHLYAWTCVMGRESEWIVLRLEWHVGALGYEYFLCWWVHTYGSLQAWICVVGVEWREFHLICVVIYTPEFVWWMWIIYPPVYSSLCLWQWMCEICLYTCMLFNLFYLRLHRVLNVKFMLTSLKYTVVTICNY